MKQLNHFYIYRIINLLNEKDYVGKKKIKNGNNPLLQNYWGSGYHIKNAIKKYGLQNFKKEILEDNIETDEKAGEREIFWISEFRKKGKAIYNIAPGGSIQAWNKGLIMKDVLGEEYNQLLSMKAKGRKKSQEWKDKIGLANKGNIPWDKGKKRSEHSKLMKGAGNSRAIKVFCIELDKEFGCIKEALLFLNVKMTAGNQMLVSNCCKGLKENAFNYHWKYA
jgi:group I intron endonuclease